MLISLMLLIAGSVNTAKNKIRKKFKYCFFFQWHYSSWWALANYVFAFISIPCYLSPIGHRHSSQVSFHLLASARPWFSTVLVDMHTTSLSYLPRCSLFMHSLHMACLSQPLCCDFDYVFIFYQFQELIVLM